MNLRIGVSVFVLAGMTACSSGLPAAPSETSRLAVTATASSSTGQTPTTTGGGGVQLPPSVPPPPPTSIADLPEQVFQPTPRIPRRRPPADDGGGGGVQLPPVGPWR